MAGVLPMLSPPNNNEALRAEEVVSTVSLRTPDLPRPSVKRPVTAARVASALPQLVDRVHVAMEGYRNGQVESQVASKSVPLAEFCTGDPPPQRSNSSISTESGSERGDESSDESSDGCSTSCEDSEEFCPIWSVPLTLPLKPKVRFEDRGQCCDHSLRCWAPCREDAIPAFRRPRARTAKPVRRVSLLPVIVAKSLARTDRAEMQSERTRYREASIERVAPPTPKAAPCDATEDSTALSLHVMGTRKLRRPLAGLATPGAVDRRVPSLPSFLRSLLDSSRLEQKTSGGATAEAHCKTEILSLADRWEVLLQGPAARASEVGPIRRHSLTGAGRLPQIAAGRNRPASVPSRCR